MTTEQLVRLGRKHKKRRCDTPALQGCPQKYGTVLRLRVMKPRIPNSANRKVARIRLSNGIEVTAYIPGDNMARHITEHTNVLVRGGGPPDLPGVKYTIIPGAQGLPGVPGFMQDGQFVPRRNSRSKYGVARPK